MLQNANEAKEKTEISEEKENIDVSIISMIGKKPNGLLEVTDATDFENELKGNYKNKDIEVTVLENSEPYIFEVTYTESGRKYYVTPDGYVDQEIEKKLIIEYRKTDGTVISRQGREYTKETVLIETLELSEEIKEQNQYEFQSAEIEKADGTKVQVGLKDEITLEESIEKVIIVYNQKEITKPKYTLTINAGNGTIAGSKVMEGEAGTKITIPTPTPPSGYTITFNANGGNVNPSSQTTSYIFNGWTLTGGGRLAGNTYTFGNQNGTITASYIHNGKNLPYASRAGYIFKGWYTSITGGTKVGDAGSMYTPTKNETLYAIWQEEAKPKYTLTINAGSGTIEGSTVQQGETGTNITIPTPTPPTGYTVIFDANGGSVSAKSFTTTYSFNRWSLTGGGTLSGNTYTFGNQNGTITASYIHNGKNLPYASRIGYIFRGWYTSITGGTKVGDAGSMYTPTKNETLYAIWQEEAKPKYTLTINAGSGTIEGSTVQQGETGTNITIPTPTPPTGYTVIFDANGGSVAPPSQTTSYTFNGWSLTGGGTMLGNTYTFGNQNGTITASYNHNDNIILPKPTNDGHIFKGWYTSNIGGTKVGDSGATYNPSKNQTLYARWEKVPELIPDVNIFFEPDITTWTNKDVTIKVRTTEQNYQIQLTTGNPQIESNWTTTNSVTLKENGTVYARLTNGNLDGMYASYNVTNIDKIAPDRILTGSLTILPHESELETVYLTLKNIRDLDSGVAKIVYCYKNQKDTSFLPVMVYNYAPLNGSKRGRIDNGWMFNFGITSSNFAKNNPTVTVNDAYIYAEIYDVAGNATKSALACLPASRDPLSATYTDFW